MSGGRTPKLYVFNDLMDPADSNDTASRTSVDTQSVRSAQEVLRTRSNADAESGSYATPDETAGLGESESAAKGIDGVEQAPVPAAASAAAAAAAAAAASVEKEVEEDVKLFTDICRESSVVLRFHTGLHNLVTERVRALSQTLYAAAATAAIFRSSIHDRVAPLSDSKLGVATMIARARAQCEEMLDEFFLESAHPQKEMRPVFVDDDMRHWRVGPFHLSE